MKVVYLFLSEKPLFIFPFQENIIYLHQNRTLQIKL
jgi:hypothetical protein